MTQEIDLVVVGAGFAGVGIGAALLESGRTSFVVLERGNDVGGTWRDNTYPGAACDVPSHLYSYSWALNPRWTRMHAPQGEILEYLRKVATDRGVINHVRLNTEVTGAEWDQATARWDVQTTSTHYRAKSLVVAVGHLSEPKLPDIPGMSDFAGTLFHSARWDHSVDLEGQRIGVVGSGATAIQVVPELSKLARHLVVFQRTPSYIMPRPDPYYSEAQKRMFERIPETMKAERAAIFWANEERFAQRRNVPALVETATQAALRHMHSQVEDPVLRDKLTPRYRLGCKRVLKSDDFYPAIASSNVTLVTEEIEKVETTGLRVAGGAAYELDALIFCTGFEATDLPISHIIRGRDGLLLSDAWRGGMGAFATSAVGGFPNMWFINGPNTGTGHNSAVYMTEVQVDYILGALSHMEQEGVDSLEVSTEALDRYVGQIEAWSEGSVWLSGSCSSWYLDPRNGRLTTLWPSSAHQFRARTSRFESSPYVHGPASRV